MIYLPPDISPLPPTPLPPPAYYILHKFPTPLRIRTPRLFGTVEYMKHYSLHFVRCLLLLARQSLFALHFSFICYFLVTFITYCSFLGYASFLIDIRSSSTAVFYLTFLLIFYFSWLLLKPKKLFNFNDLIQ